ncbi:MAG: alpha-amylase family glycosyl hydrolase, partial [Bacillota bacterium]|nr:alpha-amylase family glycosyl hydrolase [Bacillota bacterium]
MENLSFILEKLKGKKDSFNGDYFIPKMWNSFNFTNYSNDSVRYDEMKLNPYEFISDCIEKIIKNSSGKGSISSSTASDVSLESSVIYCLFPRMLTAWNHYDNNLCSGTFLKTICMLPYLKKMNVNLVYLLPIFKYSLSNRKGDTGSPYSIKNIYQLDENLHDNLLGDFNSEILETEFKAFVEACHLLGIKVMVDFVFRTVARDSDLIIEHPDWFYWINLECKNSFCAPKIEGIKAQTVVSEKLVPKIYSSRNVSDYLKQFTYSPKDIDQKKWLSLVDRYKTSGGNILELIEEEFKITTAPGFSDVIND